MLMFLDVETTGLPTRRGADYTDVEVWPRIVSISWAFHEPDGEKVEQVKEIIRPEGFTIPAESTRIHGITTAIARKRGQPISEVLRQLNKTAKRYKPSLLVAHNLDFDRAVVLAEFVRASLKPVITSLPTFCTMLEGTAVCKLPHYSGRYKWPSLEELHQTLLGHEFEDAHDAAADVQACVRCYFELDRLEAGLEPTHETTEEDDEWACIQDSIDRILSWAEDKDFFDPSFVESMQDALEEYGCLTEKQVRALENIVNRWSIY